MRWIFGIGGLLVTLLIVVMLLSAKGGPGDYTVSVLKKGQEARGEASQLAGKDASGVRASDSITLEPVGTGSRTTSLVVANIMAGGPMQAQFGLVPEDKILEMGSMRVRDVDDPEMAKALVLEAYQRKQDLIIERNGVKFRMPGLIPVDAANAAPIPVQAATPTIPQQPPAALPQQPVNNAAATPPVEPRKRSSIYDQVNQIPGVQRAE